MSVSFLNQHFYLWVKIRILVGDREKLINLKIIITYHENKDANTNDGMVQKILILI